VLPGNRIAIESWFDLTGESPAGAAVKVYRQGGNVLAEGKLDEKGLFTFPYSQREPLRVVVSAPGGHRKELDIPAAELVPDDAPSAEPESGSAGTTPASVSTLEPFADRSTKITLKDVLLGLALLFAAAGFGLALTTARKVRELRRKIHGPAANREHERPEE
jgi:hypothetical protein